jgi:hypothetical protein
LTGASDGFTAGNPFWLWFFSSTWEIDVMKHIGSRK